MTKRVVVKFGGAELRSGESFKKASEMVKETGLEEAVIVVSAMENTTDNLVGYIRSMGITDDMDYADIVSMGERISARLFCSTLKTLGLKSVYFDPQRENWPIITDSNFREAEPLIEETRTRVKKYLEPLLGECIPVICGFVGRDKRGFITTLGRGGSDITATLLGNCLEADEVILVKNTEGVLFTDPKFIPNANPLRKLSIEEMFSLAQGGAKIVHPKALRYKLPNQKLKIVSFYKGLNSEGTEITGAFHNPFKIKSYTGLCALTLVGEITAAALSEVFVTLKNEDIVGISTGRNSVTIFTGKNDKKAMLSQICHVNGIKGVSVKESIGAVELMNPEFIETPGWIAKISRALAEKEINILEISSSKATITVFLEENDLKKALEAIKAVNQKKEIK